MNVIHRVRRSRRARLTVLGAVASGALLIVSQLPADALDVTGTPSPVTGNATWFAGLGGPYGGCGMAQEDLESQNFVALNVYNTPGNYGDFPNRPMPDSLASKFGMWNNGHNCGRWVQVTMGDNCIGDNDGAMNKPFCRNGGWASDAYNGATLNMLVADSCGDGNAWCRDDPYHLDLAQPALNRFEKSGKAVGDLYPNSWNNRHISWKFIPAPDYSGDIQIGFLQSAQKYWPALSVSHLANGIHGVEYWDSGSWHQATMDGDMGQAYIVGPNGASTFQLRVRDADDQLINDGRVYTVSLPESCGSSCPKAYTKVSYTTSTEPTGTGTGTGTGTATGTGTSGSTGTGGTCTAAVTVASSWPGGYTGTVTVSNPGTTATTGWKVSLTLPSGQSVRSSWNATVTTSGQDVTATSVPYNSSIAPSGSVSWGIVVDGDGQPPATVTCSAS